MSVMPMPTLLWIIRECRVVSAVAVAHNGRPRQNILKNQRCPLRRQTWHLADLNAMFGAVKGIFDS